MKTLSAALLLFLPLIVPGGSPLAAPASQSRLFTLQERIEAQSAIERVFYEKRIWPKENKSPKPPFETMVPKELIEKKVNDSLLKSAALVKYWGKEITPAMMQSELDRMARESLDPAALHALFEALGNDPRLISETLARDNLADRLIRNRFAYDERFQGDAFRKAKALHEKAASVKDWKSLGGQYNRTVIRKSAEKNPLHDMEKPGEFAADPERFAAFATRALPVGEVSRLDETADGFHFHRTISKSDDRIETDAIVVPKRNFDEWFAEVTVQLGDPARLPFPFVGAELSSAHFSGMNRNETPRGRAELSSAPTWETAPGSQSAFTYRLPAIATVAGCDTWDDPMKINKMPEAREFHSAVWTGTEMIVWGGYNGDDPSGFRYLNSGGRYNPATDSWTSTSVSANVPAARVGHRAVWTGAEMIIWGGGSATLHDSSGGRYNPATDSWRSTSTGANVPAYRANHALAWSGTELIVWGGYDNQALALLGDGARYNPQGDTWTPVAPGPSPRMRFASAWSGSELIVWGGCGQLPSGAGCQNVLGNGARYNPGTNGWSPVSGAGAPAPREFPARVWTGSEMIVWGGAYWLNGTLVSRYNSGGRYNPATDSWQPTSTGANVPSPRSPGDKAAVWTGGEMIVWGGGTDATGGRYNPTSDSWIPTSTGIGVPQLRGGGGYTTVWTGGEMIVWGGADYNQSPKEYLNSGGRYTPGTDSWLSTADVNVLSSREYHSSVWTGSEMIIWGGYFVQNSNFYYLNTGGQYNPSTTSWITTSLGANLPSARWLHTAIWSGIEMIVWGGGGGGNTGGRYNPSARIWQPTSISGNTPSTRFLHTAIWTGSEMIIWGGGTLNTGGLYAPETDSWKPTSIGAGVPAPRRTHTAIWNGNEMIVWGGYDGTNYFNTGGRYNPASDNWFATPIDLNTPGVRSLHSAVWSNTNEMIVWGGYDGGATNNSGGKYNPAIDSWNPISSGALVPQARNQQTTIWSGSEMIVWGGYGNGYLNTGGRYTPDGDNWRSVNVSNNTPTSRDHHTAAWNGSIMMVWGGTALYVNNTGGIYTSGSVASPGNSVRGNKSSVISLNWKSVYGAGSYNVKRCNPTVTGCIPGTIVSSPTINQYSEPDDGFSHFYAVEAVNHCGATP